MRTALWLLLAPFLIAWSFFDPFHENVEKGNESAAAGESEQALERYGEAAEIDPGSPIPDFNRGVVLSADDGDPEAARDAYLAAAAADDPDIAATAHYNLGNLQMRNQDFESAIDSYLKSLDLDPDDPDTRRNLELAVERQQQQQQQQPEPQEDGEENDQEQEPQDQQEPQDEEPKDEPEQQPEQNEQSQEDEPPPPPEPQPEEFTREDAERLLNAIQTDELKVLEQLRDEQETPGVSAHDW